MSDDLDATEPTPPAVRPTHCENCNGTGTVFSQAFTPRKCEDCHGKGIAECPTLETDEVLRRNAESDQTLEEDYEALADHAANLEYRLAEARLNMEVERERADEAGLAWKRATEALSEAREQRNQLSDELSACTVTMTKAEGVILEMIEQRNAMTAAFSEWPRLREWLEMDSFIRGYMSAELPAFDAMSNALSATKGGQS